MDLVTLKKQYASLEKKYKLPKFSQLNAVFEIEKIEHDTDFPARAIRKFMIDKVLNTLSFVEMLIQQVNAPRLYQPYLRTMTPKDREMLQRIYDKLGELSLISLSLEVESNEKKECEAIVAFYGAWNAIKADFTAVLDAIRHPPSANVRKEKSYFG